MSKHKKSKKKITIPTINNRNTSNFLTNTKLHQLLIFLFSFFLYANTLTHDYTQDDAIVIYENMYTKQGINGIPDILKYDTFKGFFKVEGKDNLVAGGRYRPLTLMMFALEWQLFAKEKLDDNGQVMKDANGEVLYEARFIGHLGNVLLYALLGIILYLLCLKCFQARGEIEKAPLFALLVALFFIAHPIHTEVVANIKGRDEIVTLLGSLTALLLSIKAFEEEKWGLNILAGLLFFLGLMAKENAITFLAIVPLTYLIFTKANIGKILLQTLPFALAAAVFLIIRAIVLDGGGFGGDAPKELMNNPFLKIENNQWVYLSFSEKMSTITYTLGKYIQLLIVPHPLTHDYYPRHINIMSWGNWQVLLSVLVHLGLAVYAIWGLLKKNILSYGILFYLITLTIVSNVVFPIGTNMAERFIFMPSVGFCIVLTALLFKGKDLLNGKVNLLLGAAGVILFLFSAKTFTRNLVWKDNYTLFTTDIAVSKNSAKLRNSVGGVLTDKAKSMPAGSARTATLQEAITHLQEAKKIHPTYKNAYLIAGNAHNYLQQYEQAIQNYNQALRLDANYQEAYNNRTLTYRAAGLYYGKEKGDFQKSIQYLTEAQKVDPNDYETLFALGVAYGLNGNNQQATTLFLKCTQLQPNVEGAWRNLGNAYMIGGEEGKGRAALQKADSLK